MPINVGNKLSSIGKIHDKPIDTADRVYVFGIKRIGPIHR